jgi:Tol biopolymer transport system component
MTDQSRLAAAIADRYRVEREIGVGGMATVYLAQDLKHHRRVAIKVLHADLSAVLGPERFHKEIELTAGLQHPHILPLFDSGSAEGLLYYVMPHVEGETLRARLERETQLPIADAVRIATEVADALEYAHRHGVIHRDIKPENILLRDGHALVSDFGIALAVAEAGGQRMTQTGTSLGTPQYMAPEQAMGDQRVDGRVDVYALGVVTYEMLVGEPPFTGPTAQAIVAKVMTEEPRGLILQRRMVPEPVEQAVLTALQKLPADRFAAPAEFARALAGDGAAAGTRRARVPRVGRAAARPSWVWGIAAIGIAVGGYLLGSAQRGTRGPIAAFGAATKVTWERGLEIEPALSPDGRAVAYAEGTSTHMRIYVRQVSGGRPIRLTDDTPGNQTSPQWSPDGSRVYFVTDAGLASAPSAGGAARPEMPAPDGAVISAAISPDGSEIVYALEDSLYLRAGGRNRFLAAVREATLCQWAPSGAVVACASGNSYYSRLGRIYGNLAPSRIVTVRIKDGAVVPVTDSLAANQSPAWSGDGRWLYYVSNRLGPLDIYAVPMNGSGGPAGPPSRLTTGLGAHEISVSKSGTRLAFDNLTTQANLWTLPFPPPASGPGTPLALTSGAQVVEEMTPSRDGEWIFFDSNVNGHSELYRERLPNAALPFFGPGDPEQLTFDSTDDFSPAPSPDGREVAFHSFRSGSRDVYVLPLDGRPVQTVTSSPRQESKPDWAPNGKALVFTDYSAQGGIWVARRDSNGTWGAPIRISYFGSWPAWSPDSRSIAFVSNILGGALLVVGPDSAPQRVILDRAKDGGPLAEEPQWSPDGGTIYFKSHDAMGRAEFWAVPRNGGTPRLVLRFDGDRPSDRPEWSLGGGRMYFTVNDRQSDIWVMEAIPK